MGSTGFELKENRFEHVSRFILIAMLCSGCTPSRVTDAELAAFAKTLVPVDERTRAWVLAIADPIAQATIDEFNASPDVGRDGGPFHLDQYARDVVGYKGYRADLNADPEVIEYHVDYRLTVQVLFFGHPEHFSVVVCKADGSAKLMHGF